ncbi:MAG: HalX domain-containing protein [Haloarculaceae archaeon]
MDLEYELSATLVERNVLRAELEEEDLWDSDKFQRLEQRIGELKTRMEADGSHSEPEPAVG